MLNNSMAVFELSRMMASICLNVTAGLRASCQLLKKAIQSIPAPLRNVALGSINELFSSLTLP